MRPSKETNQVVEYCLAVAAARTEVQLHAFVAMSNHIHVVLTDTVGRLPEFLHHFHRNVAIALNASLKRTENFWAAGAPSVLELADAHDVLEKMAYVAANPTIAGLVEQPKEWPGALVTIEDELRPLTRPPGYFRTKGPMPDEATLHCVLPPQLENIDPSRARQMFRDVLTKKLHSAHRAIRAAALQFAGPRRVQRMNTNKRPSTREAPLGRRPRFAVRDRIKRQRVLSKLRGFWLAYREALARWREGHRDVRFPEGTWLMRRVHGVQCGAFLAKAS